MKALNEKALLVSLSISQWQARKYDNKVTREVNAMHNATDAGRFNKSLIGRKHLEAISKVANEARAFHYENTLPWGDNGERILNSMNYFDYVNKIAELQVEFEKQVNIFILNYPAMIDEAKQNLNGLFNESEYPKNVRGKFGMSVKWDAIAEISDFRMSSLPAEEIEKLKAEMTAEINNRFADAQRDIYQRVVKHLNNMQERLSNVENKFHDSLFNNVLELVALLPKLNVANDAGINEMCEQLRVLYVTPDNVRKDVQLRKQKESEINNLLNNFTSFLAA